MLHTKQRILRMNAFTTFWKSRTRLFNALSSAGALLTLSLVVVLLIRAMVPPTLALVQGEIVSRILGVDDDLLSMVLLSLVLFASVLALGQLTEAIIQPVEYLAMNRIDGAHRASLSQMIAAVPTIELLEQSDVQAMIREVEADPRNGFDSTPGQGATALLRWLTGLIGIIFSGIVLARYSWWLPFVVIIPATVNTILRDRQNVIVTQLWQKAIAGELHADVWRRATVSSGPSKEIRVFAMCNWMINRMQYHIAAANMPLWRYINRLTAAEWSQFVLVAIGLVPAYMVVTYAVLNGTTTLAVLTIVLAAGVVVYRDLAGSGIIHHIAGGAAILATTERLRDMLQSRVVRQVNPSSSSVMLKQDGRPPRIVFDEVIFHYPQTNRLILDRLTLTIEPGETLALVGLNGSGKSTLVKLLTGLYTPISGRILVDGQDLSTIDLDMWRTQVALIFQDFIRYPLSVRENVTFNESVSDEQLLSPTITNSGIASVLERLPKQWDTPLARSRSGGVDLSGGQWQQIALARALYRVHTGARLLVLDEPTAHLDVRTESQVFGRLNDLHGKVGLILISHRLATVRNADRIVLLENGRIAESGSHDELMILKGRYQSMFSLQARRFAQGYDDRIDKGEW